MTCEFLGGNYRKTQRKSRVWLCSAQLVLMFVRNEWRRLCDLGHGVVHGVVVQLGHICHHSLVNMVLLIPVCLPADVSESLPVHLHAGHPLVLAEANHLLSPVTVRIVIETVPG
jgi:hypothetical protein